MEPYNFGFVDPFLSRIKTHKLERIKITVSIPENDFEKLICPLINADKPKTPNILNIFEPTTLPIATLPLPLIKEAIVTLNF